MINLLQLWEQMQPIRTGMLGVDAEGEPLLSQPLVVMFGVLAQREPCFMDCHDCTLLDLALQEVKCANGDLKQKTWRGPAHCPAVLPPSLERN